MKHKTRIQIRFKDIDKLGHVNNANHFTYLELARIHYFDQLMGREIDWEKDGMIIASAKVDYKQPIYLSDKVFVYTQCANIGNKSFEFHYNIIREEKDGTETVLATAQTVQVCFDYKLNQTIPVPKEWKEKMEYYENS